MANENGNGTQPWYARIAERAGAPTIIVIVLAVIFGRPIINSYVENVNANTDAVQRLSESVQQLTKGVDKIVEVELESQTFMREVHVEHQEQLHKLDTIVEAVQ